MTAEQDNYEHDRSEPDRYTHTGPTNPDRTQWPLISVAAMLFLAMGSGGILIGSLLKGQYILESYHLETIGTRMSANEKRVDDFVREVRAAFLNSQALDAQQTKDVADIRANIATVKANQEAMIGALHDLTQRLNGIRPQSGEVMAVPPADLHASVDDGAVVMFQGIAQVPH